MKVSKIKNILKIILSIIFYMFYIFKCDFDPELLISISYAHLLYLFFPKIFKFYMLNIVTTSAINLSLFIIMRMKNVPLSIKKPLEKIFDSDFAYYVGLLVVIKIYYEYEYKKNKIK